MLAQLNCIFLFLDVYLHNAEPENHRYCLHNKHHLTEVVAGSVTEGFKFCIKVCFKISSLVYIMTFIDLNVKYVYNVFHLS